MKHFQEKMTDTYIESNAFFFNTLLSSPIFSLRCIGIKLNFRCFSMKKKVYL